MGVLAAISHLYEIIIYLGAQRHRTIGNTPALVNANCMHVAVPGGVNDTSPRGVSGRGIELQDQRTMAAGLVRGPAANIEAAGLVPAHRAVQEDVLHCP